MMASLKFVIKYLAFLLGVLVTEKLTFCRCEEDLSKRWISPLSASALKLSDCDQTLIPVMENFKLSKFSGDWYEIGKTVSGYVDLNDGMWKISGNTSTASFIYSGRNSLDYCTTPINGRLTSSTENPGELVLHYRTQTSAVTERIRILYTDYDHLAVVYSCQYVKLSTGTCHPTGAIGAIWARLTHVDVTKYNTGIEILSKACVDIHVVQIRNRVGPCKVFNPALTSNEEGGARKLARIPVCAVPAKCALHCPPCCRKINSCVKCDCENVIADKLLDCIEPSKCPVECTLTKRSICFICSCNDPNNEFNIPGICFETKEEGECGEKLTRYYFKASTNTCEQFLYTGCEGNSNNFASFEDCMKTCKGEDPGDGVEKISLFSTSNEASGIIHVSIVLFIINMFLIAIL